MLIWKRTIVLILIWGVILGWMTTKEQACFAFTPQEVVRNVRQRFESIQDYRCQFITTSYKNGKAKSDINNYFFKKPKLIRLEVANGDDKGAVAIFNKNGKVRAHAGGLLGIFKITMEPNDKRLQDSDGSTFIDSHLGVTISDLEKAISGAQVVMTEFERGRKIFQLQIDRGDKREVVLIDGQLMLPIEWQSLRNGQPTSKTEWKNLVVDSGIGDGLFEM